MFKFRSLFVVILAGLAYAGFAQDEQDAPKPKPEVIYFGAFCPDEKLVTVGSHEDELEPVCCSISNGKVLSLWDVPSGKRLEKLVLEDDLEQTAVSPDGKMLASWNTEECDHFADGAVRMYSLDRTDDMFGVRLGTLGGPICQVISAAFGPDNKTLAVSYRYGSTAMAEEKSSSTQPNVPKSIRMWDVRTYTETSSLPVETEVYELKFSKDGRFLAATMLSDETSGMDVGVWDLHQKTQIGQAPIPEDQFEFQFAEDSSHLIIGDSLTAYKLPVSEVDGKLEQVKLEPAETNAILGQNHLSVMEDETSFTLRNLRDVYSGIRITKKNPRATQREDSGLILNVGMLDVSEDGRYALIDSDIVDMLRFELKKLELIVPKNSAHYELTPATD